MSDAPAGGEPLPAGFTRQERSVNGTTLSYLIGGRGPLVVLLHGWPQTARAWRLLLAPLAEWGYTVVAPDLRGTGRSARTSAGYEKENQAEDLHQLLSMIGTDLEAGPGLRIVGHDIGGMVAFAYARRHPEAVSRLVLMELAVPGFGLEQAMDVARGGLWHFGFFLTPDVPEMLIDGHEQEFFTWWYDHFAAAPGALDAIEVQDTIRSYTGRTSLGAGFGHYRTLLDDTAANRDWYDAGGRLTMPVLAVGGSHGVGDSLAGSIREATPGVRAAVVQDSGHFVPEENPSALLDILAPFLE